MYTAVYTIIIIHKAMFKIRIYYTYFIPMREDIKSSKGQGRILQLKDVTVTPQVKLMVRSYGYTNRLVL